MGACADGNAEFESSEKVNSAGEEKEEVSRNVRKGDGERGRTNTSVNGPVDATPLLYRWRLANAHRQLAKGDCTPFLPFNLVRLTPRNAHTSPDGVARPPAQLHRGLHLQSGVDFTAACLAPRARIAPVTCSTRSATLRDPSARRYCPCNVAGRATHQ